MKIFTVTVSSVRKGACQAGMLGFGRKNGETKFLDTVDLNEMPLSDLNAVLQYTVSAVSWSLVKSNNFLKNRMHEDYVCKNLNIFLVETVCEK